MNPINVEEIELNFIRASDLLRVKTFIKELKQEDVNPDLLRLIASTYTTLERVKVISNDIDRLHSMQELTADEQYQLYLFEDIRRDLLLEIENATISLESRTNLLVRRSAVVSVLDDLEQATNIFKGMVLSEHVLEFQKVQKRFT